MMNKVLRNLRRTGTAFGLLQTALRMQEQNGTVENLEVADLLTQMGILKRQGLDHHGPAYDDAAQLFARAKRIHKQMKTFETDKGALLMLNIAILHVQQGEHVTA